MGGTCYGVRATLLVGLVTDVKALYTESTWGRGSELGIQLLGPAADDVAYYRTTHVCSRGLSSVRP